MGMPDIADVLEYSTHLQVHRIENDLLALSMSKKCKECPGQMTIQIDEELTSSSLWRLDWMTVTPLENWRRYIGAPHFVNKLAACKRSSGEISSVPLALLKRQYTSANVMMPPPFWRWGSRKSESYTAHSQLVYWLFDLISLCGSK